jgi:glyoxylase-like metal-dependent hydrolase (beta-lactamase superfamily II)
VTHDSARLTRRTAIGCAAHLALAAALAPRHAWASALARHQGRVVATTPFARLEQLGTGLFAVVSTPFRGERTTLANGGLIVGRTGIVAIEGFFQPAGATWLAQQCRALTGRLPSHIVCTHYHSDHVNGITGYYDVANDQATKAIDPPMLRMTAATRELAAIRNTPVDAARSALLADIVVTPADAPSTIDLGDRVVRVMPRAGHTSSDVSIELDDPSVVFAGDLLWNGVVPNYVDATPSLLAASARALRRTRDTIYVPGHGSVAGDGDMARYLDLLEELERLARSAHARGASAADAVKGYALPAALGEWAVFNPVFFERAVTAWYRELGAPSSF